MKSIIRSILIVITFGSILTFGCKKSNEGEIVIDAVTNILLIDGKGKNLLVEPSAIDTKNINIYYMLDGKAQLVNKGNLDAPKGFEKIKNKKNEDVIKLYLNTNEEMPVTLISYGGGEPDTLECEFSRKKGSVICTKIWYNGVLKWDVSNDNSSNEREFSVLKE